MAGLRLLLQSMTEKISPVWWSYRNYKLARSILRRMGIVKRKGTKAVKTLPSDFESIKCEFVKKVEKVVSVFSYPYSLVINFDQTGCQLVRGVSGQWRRRDPNKVFFRRDR